MEKNNSHLAGEYFVAAELYRRGFSVGMTIGNAKAIDMFANKNNKTLNIQVKAIASKKSSGWPIMLDKVTDGILYIFVNLNNLDHPEYFIATPKETRENVQQYENRGTISCAALKSKKYKDRWDKIEKLSKPISKSS